MSIGFVVRWLLVMAAMIPTIVMEFRFHILLQDETIVVMFFGFRMKYFDLLLRATDFHRFLEQVEILLLNVDRHRMEVMQFYALMGGGMFMVHVMMQFRLRVISAGLMGRSILHMFVASVQLVMAQIMDFEGIAQRHQEQSYNNL